MLRTRTKNLIPEIHYKIIISETGLLKMKKIILLLVLSLSIFGGCQNSETDQKENAKSSVSNFESSSQEYYFELNFKDLKYTNNSSKIELTGTGKPNSNINIFKYEGDKKTKIDTFTSDKNGSFTLVFDAPEKQNDFLFTNGDNKNLTTLYSQIEQNRLLEEEKSIIESKEKTNESLAEKNRIENEKRSEELRTSTENEESRSIEEELQSSDTSKYTATSQAEITNVSTDHKEQLIAYTQLDCEDKGYKLSYTGKDKWNIAVNYIDGKNSWIVTTNDKKQGRVKAVYIWDGNNDSQAELVYLLVGGNELLNKM